MTKVHLKERTDFEQDIKVISKIFKDYIQASPIISRQKRSDIHLPVIGEIIAEALIKAGLFNSVEQIIDYVRSFLKRL